MRIFFPIEQDAGLESKLDSRFGRAGYFLIYDTEKEQIESVTENMFNNMEHGVGIKVATYAVETGCELIIGAQPGPKAADIIRQANIKTITSSGTIKTTLPEHQRPKD
jgi:predicted Fe-Mo cluster-binding NifX family protein